MEYSFSFLIRDADPEDDLAINALVEAGCDDATLAFQYGVLSVDFDREADSYIEAVISAYIDLRATQFPVVAFEPDNLVSISDIAKRVSLTRAAVTLYASHERQKQFPSPCRRVHSNSPLYDWVEVSRWGNVTEAKEMISAALSRAASG